MRVAYLNLIATGIVLNIRASSSHIGQMMAFSEHRRWIICVFDRRSIMNRLYWHNQQVGYLCFIPFVWEQRGVIAAVADQTAMISHLLPMCWATWGWLWGHVGAVCRGAKDRSRYSGIRVIVARVIVALDCIIKQLEKVCRMLCSFQNSKIKNFGEFFKFVTLALSSFDLGSNMTQWYG